MYEDIILKFDNLKQAHVNTIFQTPEKNFCQIRNVRMNVTTKVISKSKQCT